VADEADRRSDMTLAPERPCRPVPEEHGGLLDIAEMVHEKFPGHRAEILGGQLIVTPSADGPHAESLTGLTLAFAGLHRGETRVLQNIGLWLPTGDDDHAVPDLAIVEADYRDHEVAYKCYDSAVFRLIVEITSNNWRTDVDEKPDHYARAGIPVYVIGDRKHDEIVVLTDPQGGEYRTRSVHKPGESFTLPESIGAKVELEVDSLLLK
jgi:hypothetical protein